MNNLTRRVLIGSSIAALVAPAIPALAAPAHTTDPLGIELHKFITQTVSDMQFELFDDITRREIQTRIETFLANKIRNFDYLVSTLYHTDSNHLKSLVTSEYRLQDSILTFNVYVKRPDASPKCFTYNIHFSGPLTFQELTIA